MQDQPPTLLAKLSPWSVRLVAAWVLAVSAIKLFKGSPGDIPLIVRENPLGEELTFFATISIELAFSLVALVLPRWGWALMSTLMSVFVAVLLHLISIGATSCGCFGGAITLSPPQMLAIDGSLFAFMLATRPWKHLPRRSVPWVPLTAGAVLGALAPWLLIENQEVVVPQPTASVHPVDVATDPALNPAGAASAPKPQPPLAQAPGAATPPTAPAGTPPKAEAPRPNAEGGTIAVTATSADDWALPAKLPRWARLRPPEWVGKSIHDTDLAIWMNTRLYPTDATWILYLETCTHCRDYLNELEEQFAQDPKLYVFVCLSTPNDERESVIQKRPPGETAKLPAEVQWVVGPKLPPWELVLENEVVKAANEHGE